MIFLQSDFSTCRFFITLERLVKKVRYLQPCDRGEQAAGEQRAGGGVFPQESCRKLKERQNTERGGSDAPFDSHSPLMVPSAFWDEIFLTEK